MLHHPLVMWQHPEPHVNLGECLEQQCPQVRTQVRWSMVISSQRRTFIKILCWLTCFGFFSKYRFKILNLKVIWCLTCQVFHYAKKKNPIKNRVLCNDRMTKMWYPRLPLHWIYDGMLYWLTSNIAHVALSTGNKTRLSNGNLHTQFIKG